MKQLVVLSGKGGTGKTVVAAAFAHLSSRSRGGQGAVCVDADVDAANLELLIGRGRLEEHEFIGAPVAVVEPEECEGCGICLDVCRFGAVERASDGWTYQVDPRACEGCATCFHQCPEEAIRMVPQLAGHWYRSETYNAAPFLHARLRPAQENSGKLVTLIRDRALSIGSAAGYPLMIVDGPPGLACPAIAASAGADMALLVAEPTAAGFQDLERTLTMLSHFGLRGVVAINKHDLHPAGARRIEEGCRDLGVPVVERVPYDEAVARATAAGKPVTEVAGDSPAGRALQRVWEGVREVLEDTEPAYDSIPFRAGTPLV